jgi:hypothetical protein
MFVALNYLNGFIDGAGVSKKVGLKDPTQRKGLPINHIITKINCSFT